MSTDTLEKTSLLDVDRLVQELREAHRLLEVNQMGHYWTPNLDTFSTTVLPMLKSRMS